MTGKRSSSSGSWYTVRGAQTSGPFELDDLGSKLSDGKLSWADYVWSLGDSDWRRFCDVPEFERFAPKKPSREALSKLRAILRGELTSTGLHHPSKKYWLLQFEGSEFGPMTTEEAQAVIRGGKLKGKLLIRRESEPTWKPIGEIEEFTSVLTSAQIKDAERRRSRRVELVGSVRFGLKASKTPSYQVRNGVCLDISLTGMQVACLLKDDLFEGSFLGLDVTPKPEVGIAPFKCEAEVVRLLPRNTGFAARFTSLERETVEAIRNYIASRVS